MGLFSKSVTTVGTSVMRVIKDDSVQSSITSGCLKSLISKDGQMVANVMEDLVSGIGTRANRMYNYGRDHYEYGLPSATIMTSTDGQSVVQSTIEGLLGGSITMDYYHFGVLNLLHVGWITLMQSFGYNPTTNELAAMTVALGGKTAYLKDMQVVVTEATLVEKGNGSLDQWGTPPNAGFVPQMNATGTASTLKEASPFIIDAAVGQDKIRVTYAWEEPVQILTGTKTDYIYNELTKKHEPVVTNVYATVNTLKTANFDILLSAYDTQADWHQVKYTHAGVAKYWLYRGGAGTYPAIDTVFSPIHSGLGTYFPWTYFRYEKTAQNKDTTSEDYKSSVKLTNYLRMDFDALTTSIHENPDISDVEQAMMIMAVPAITENEIERQYLFDYFNALYIVEGSQNSDMHAETADLDAILFKPVPETSLLIQDKRFKMGLNYRNIVRQTLTGTIAKIGKHSSEFTEKTYSQKGMNAEGQEVNWTTTIPCFIYRRQLSESQYEELQVYNLKLIYHIYGEYSSVGIGNNPTLLVPIDHAITNTYSVLEREELLTRALHYVFNSRIVTKLKWYQTGVFQVIMIIVAIVLTVLDWGTDGGTWLALAFGLSGYALLIAMIVVNLVLTPLLLGLLFKLFVKVFGVKLAMLVAILAIIYGGYQYTSDMFAGVKGAPFAQMMLEVSTGLQSAAMNAKYDDLLADSQAFLREAKERTKLLETAEDLLGTKDPKLSALIVFGESPEDYYNRTVQSGNIGVESITAINSYVDIMLTLPKFNETI